MILSRFEQWLSGKGLSKKTIRDHIGNVEFYINDFLLYEEPVLQAKDGYGNIDLFLGHWFIRKAMWASQSSIRNNASSLKKFYTFMHESKEIDKDCLEEVFDTIKTEMPEWLATLKKFDDPDEDLDGFWD